MGFTVLFLVTDRTLKILAEGADYSFLNGFFEIIYRENTGIAFGLPVPVWASILLTAVLIICGGFFVLKNFNLEKKSALLAVSFILAGALGNMYDRVFLGYVVDYISIWKWPVFNFADMCIFCGALIIAVKFDKVISSKKLK